MNEIPLSGWWDGATHHFPTRVYYADTDAGGVVYHSRYLDFAERARTEMMRLIDLDQTYLTSDQGVLFVVRACEIDYRRPAALDDVLMVRTRLLEMGGASFRVEQQICRGETVLASLVVTLVCVRDIGHPTRIPERLREKMTALMS